MNIIKIVFSMALTFAAATASADLLYWQVGGAVGNDMSGRQGEEIDFAYATVKADGTKLYNYTSEGPSEYWKLYSTGYMADPGSGMSNTTGSGAAYFGAFDVVTSFLVELWDTGGTRVGWQRYSADDVANNIWHSNTPAESGATPFVVTDVVPEPTSGLLLLFGLAGLAIRRKRIA